MSTRIKNNLISFFRMMSCILIICNIIEPYCSRMPCEDLYRLLNTIFHNINIMTTWFFWPLMYNNLYRGTIMRYIEWGYDCIKIILKDTPMFLINNVEKQGRWPYTINHKGNKPHTQTNNRYTYVVRFMKFR